ncbi:hypothetical protein BDZ89DRAFT_1000535 [Hymenopellis radicata]|nr:hypothetical protein BDZ89DRAFT_1000535 [Hymenopellis radicata]
MFSSFNTFLPSVLSTHKSPSPQPPPIQMEAEEEETKDPEEEKGLEKEKKANETFIFVRPPPAKSNHPLNLQVQLVPPNSRAPGGVSTTTTPRQSIDGDSQSVEDVPLSRTSSNRSDYSSTASLSSFSSTSSGRRTIIPLYNLQAHNVMTNTIVDAGTDAKIAKFAKRGIEMIDLAGMEPIEVWAANANRPLLISVGTLDPNNIVNNSRSSYLGSRPTTPTPTSSAISLSSAGSHVPSVSSDGQAPKKKENIFGRMFKKKGEPIPIPNIPSPIPSTPNVIPTTPKRHSRHLSATSPYMPRTQSPTPSKRLSLSSTTAAPPPPPQDSELPPVPLQVLLPATLGVQPVLNISVPPPPNPATYATLVSLFTSSAYPPQFAKGGNPFIGRGPAMYVWSVRRWFKGNEGNSVIAGMLSGGRQPTVGEGVDVRVEWRRGRKPKSRGRKADAVKERDMAAEEQADKKRFRRISVASVSSIGSVEPGSRAGSRIRRQRTVDLGEGEDDGEESDPEDSETPWTCTVKVKRVGPSSPGVLARGSGNVGASVKIKVGTLSPTPHHPKVVAMLKVPYPLPDVEVDRVNIVKRKVITVSADGDPVAGEEGTKRVMVSEGKLMGLVLSAEEIKDVVCSTGLWLVVREGFGGVGKVSRKGDGWRIRA